MMKTTRILALVSVIGIGAAAYHQSPVFRTQVHDYISQARSWSLEARASDPVGFTIHAEKQLRVDLKKLNAARGRLVQEIDLLDRKVREQQALAQQADQLAGDFRKAYLVAERVDKFPISVAGAAYTKSQAASQLKRLLAEKQGFANSVQKLTQVQTEVEAKLEELTVRINNTDVQLASLRAQRQLLEQGVLADRGETLVSQIDELLVDSQRAVEQSPIRTVRELAARNATSGQQAASVDDFLATGRIADKRRISSTQRH